MNTIINKINEREEDLMRGWYLQYNLSLKIIYE